MYGRLFIGDGMDGPIVKNTAYIPRGALTRHVCVLGATGSGKSTLGCVLVFELGREKIPTLVLDRTGEYATKLSSLEDTKVYRPGENLRVALFDREPGVSLALQVEKWVDLLAHFIQASHRSDLSPLQLRILRELLTQYYTGTSEVLTISKLISKLRQYEDRVTKRRGWEESIEALVSRLVPLTVDLVGETLDRPYSNLKVEDFVGGQTSVVDLSVLASDEAKNLLSQIIIKRIYEKARLFEPTDDVRFALVIDEAHHLSPNREYVSIPELCALELRKYGFCLVMLASRPSLVSSNILANCATLCSFMLTSERDCEEVSRYMVSGNPLAIQSKLRILPIGSALVQQNFPAPGLPVICRVGTSEHKLIFGLPEAPATGRQEARAT